MDQHITAPSLITGHAASAGGLTLAAAINAQPEWFSAAVLEAPFVDWVAGTGAVDEAGLPLVGDHLLTQHETDEWGDPWRDPAVAELVCRLCPYTNLRAGVTYPAMMLTAGLQDSRVDWWMPVKFVAKLRSMQAHSMRTGAGNGCSSSAVPVVDNNSRGVGDVLLQFDESGSHFSMGLSGGNLQDAALQQAFMLTRTATPPA
jgi:oligopeptidase B